MLTQPSDSGNVSVAPAQRIEGLRFKSSDGNRTLVAGENGLSYSVRRPYPGWEVLRDETKECWAAYCKAYRPQAVNRIAIRYINLIRVPVSDDNEDGKLEIDLADYFRNGPVISDDLPNIEHAVGFYVQVLINQPDLNSQLLLRQARIGTDDRDTFNVALDIDLFCTAESWSADDDSIWSFLESLRIRKNQVFEASLTSKAKELFR